ncbi:MAG TPA: amidohydrolase family protein [Candidatus Copromorpha excrementigallinarum]|uniref:Amidohydrolase family protein n=1 Tax=Candidatus Allocopromorpha excrementigallinarum TaxID=2840742 RepID=A0A9D1I235_9FIRM|nr:amidohydrolase family protein [Candidatus Copromorpha excrementigallinarum]
MYSLLFKNGNILTMDGQMSVKRWLAVDEHGKIAALGDRDDFPEAAGDIIDLKGRTLMPGIIDSHVHSSMSGIDFNGIDLSGIDSCQGVLDAVEAYCRGEKSPRLICGWNMNLKDGMTDKRLPTRYELDEVTGEHTVMLVFWTAHGGVMNSRAVERARLPEEFRYVEKDGYFNRDDVSFYVIGAIYALHSEAEFKQIYMDLGNKCAAYGITTIGALDGMMVKDDMDVEIILKIHDQLPVEWVNYTQTFDYEKVLGYGLPRIGGCLTIDGSPPQLTAAYFDSYPCAPYTRGLLEYSDKHLYDFITECTKRGLQCAFHAIGDRAVDQIVRVYQQVDKEIGIRENRHRVEHFSLASDEIIEAAAEMGLVAVPQPAIGNALDLGEKGNGFEAFVSPEKAQRHENFNYLIKGGLTVAGSSDSPCSPLDPFAGIDAVVNAHNPARRASMDTALQMYTRNGAYVCRKEKEIGSLEPGKYADMIILDKSPYDVHERIDRETLKVMETFKRGRSIFKM